MENDKLQEKQQDTRNFADKWLNNIFEVLMRIEDYERLAKNGCITILDYVQNPDLDLAVIQERNYQLFMTEVEIILNDIKHFVNKKEMLKLIIKFNLIKSIEKDVNGFLDVRVNYIAHTSENVLKPEYYNIHSLISELRGLLVTCLLEFINPKINFQTEKRF